MTVEFFDQVIQATLLAIVVLTITILCCYLLLLNAAALSQAQGKTLQDGIPELHPILSSSGALIPLEICHASCSCNVLLKFSLWQVEESVFRSPNFLWHKAKTWRGNKLTYSSETQIVMHVCTFLEDIIRAMNLKYDIGMDFGIKDIAPNICIITQGKRFIGVVNVKKPDHGALDQPTIMGELLDQMLLVEGFYRSGPVIGILTTLEEWRFCWLPSDDQHFTEDNWESFQSESYWTTTKAKASPTSSPPRNTPSQSGDWAHTIHEDEDPEDQDLNQLPQMSRKLSATEVLNIYENYDLVLQHICTALKRMSQVNPFHTKGIPQVLFKLHKDQCHVSFHPISEIPLDMNKLCSSKFPRCTTTSLLAVEDLGRGSSGKAWLTCTQTKSRSKSPAICVLKYGNEGSYKLEYEKRIWDELYPEFKGKIKIEIWSGSLALVMPHFCSVQVKDRDKWRGSMQALLKNRFHDKGYIHQDVRWSNIGFYLKNKSVALVLYDLESVRVLNDRDDPRWVDNALLKLFEKSGS